MKTRHTWHTLTTNQTLSELSGSADGLTTDEAQRRLQEYGSNELPQAEGATSWEILFSQFKNVLIVILLVATALSAFLGEVLESAVIGVIVLFAIPLGFVQEFRAERAMEALRRMAAPTALPRFCATVTNEIFVRASWCLATSS